MNYVIPKIRVVLRTATFNRKIKLYRIRANGDIEVYPLSGKGWKHIGNVYYTRSILLRIREQYE